MALKRSVTAAAPAAKSCGITEEIVAAATLHGSQGGPNASSPYGEASIAAAVAAIVDITLASDAAIATATRDYASSPAAPFPKQLKGITENELGSPAQGPEDGIERAEKGYAPPS